MRVMPSDAISTPPPKDDLFRAITPGASLRDDGDGTRPVMFGYFTVFDQWAEIDSAYEGHFLERVAPGAAAKTITENRKNMRVLFHHGQDRLGLQVLGAIEELYEDERGAYYEVGLFDIPQLVLDGLRSGVYGSSYRFKVIDDDYVKHPRRSDHNPKGMPERTIREVKVREFGPTPFPAFAGATSGVRSMTDAMLLERLASEPARFDEIVQSTGVSLAGLAVPERGEDGYRHARAVEYIGEAAWAIHPAALETILQIVGERSSGYSPSPEEIRERIGARDADVEPAASEPSVAVLDLSGPIIPKANLMSQMSGGTSIERFRGAFREALASEDVKAIVLNIDSPGGSVEQIPEMGAEILAARGQKPIVAQANTWAASGAYWIASAADEIVVTPSGEVGSIGVYSAHDDISGAQEKLGIKKTLVKAGKYKVEANPWEPLGDEAKAEMQRKVDAYYDMFVAAVATGRGVSDETVREDFGQGRMLMSSEAVAAGLADRVGTLDETLDRLLAQTANDEPEEPEPSEATTPSPGPEPSEVTTSGHQKHAADTAPGPSPARAPVDVYPLTKQKENPAWRI